MICASCGALPFWTAVTLLEQAEWLTGQDRPDAGSPIRDEARAIFESLGARPWLDRVNGVGVAADSNLTSARQIP
jgi:hypothetical protein